MGLMDKQIGTLESVFITYGGGGLLIGLIMLLSRGGNLSGWQGVPWYALSSGALGLVIVGTIGVRNSTAGIGGGADNHRCCPVSNRCYP